MPREETRAMNDTGKAARDQSEDPEARTQSDEGESNEESQDPDVDEQSSESFPASDPPSW